MRAYTPSQAADAGVRLCVVGDSIVAGTGDAAGLGWTGRLAAAGQAAGRDLTIYPLGVRGDTSQDVARRWRAEAEARLSAVFRGGLVFAFGLNDCTMRYWDDGLVERRVAPETTLDTTRAVLLAAASWVPVVLIGPAPVDDSHGGPQLLAGVRQHTSNADIRGIDQGLKSVADDVGVPYLSTFDQLMGDVRFSAALAAGDGIHPTATGYDVLAGVVGRWSGWTDLPDVARRPTPGGALR